MPTENLKTQRRQRASGYAMPETAEDTAAADAAREAAANRARFIANLRMMADLLEYHPDVPVPYNVTMTAYTDMETARRGRHGIAGWVKETSRQSSGISYTKTLPGADGKETWRQGTVTLELYVNKSGTCQRVQVGTRHVEAVPAHEEPVMAWYCGKDDDS